MTAFLRWLGVSALALAMACTGDGDAELEDGAGGAAEGGGGDGGEMTSAAGGSGGAEGGAGGTGGVGGQPPTATPPYGSTGIVTTDTTGFGRVVHLRPDGKVLLVGETAQAIEVVQQLPDGSPDMSFGTAGVATLNVATSDNVDSTATALQSDGKLLVGAQRAVTGENALETLIARFNVDGTPDLSFGTGGYVVEQQATLGAHHIFALATDDQGRIFAAGSEFRRYLSDGTLDVELAVDPFEWIMGMGKQSDGRMVVAQRKSSTADGSTIRRRLADGTLDTAFPTTTIASVQFLEALYVLGDDTIRFAGTDSAYAVVFGGLHADGTEDTTIGTDGTATIGGVLGDYVVSLLPLTTGASMVVSYNGISDELVLLRIDGAGALDMSFGVDGFRRWPYVVTGGIIEPQDAAVHADDKVITSFYAVDHRAARFTPDGELDAP